MIKKIEVTKSFAESQEEFLKSLQMAVVEGMRAPLGILLNNNPEHVRRTQIIIDSIREKFPDADTTFVIPGTVIQILFPKKELMVTIVSLINKISNEKTLRMELCKLSSEDE